VLKDGVDKKELTVVPYELQLDYDYWTYRTEQALFLISARNIC
jgi:tRNA (guanine37-N1)-methyltransferase